MTGELGNFDQLADSGQTMAGGRDLERIMEVPMTLHVQLGSKRMRVSELLEVGVGSVIELDTAAGTPLGIYANHTLIAQGEAVVVGERYGIRVTDIISPAERVRRLGHGSGM